MSSAYIRQSILLLFRRTGLEHFSNILGKSLIKIINKLGVKTSPCLAPILDGNGVATHATDFLF
jgi:hypothetical protein